MVPLRGAQPREMAPPTSSAPVLLGFAGRMVGGGERLDHRTTKIGGVPDWPPSAAAAADADPDGSLHLDPAAPPAEMTACARCGETMALVAQAHAPLVSGELADGAAVADRTLYLFACFSRACRASTAAGADARRWKCVRAQARGGDAGPHPPATSFAGDAPAAPHPEVEDEGAPVGAVGDDWSAGGGDWGGGEWGGGEGASRGVDDPLDAADQMDDLARALDALASDPSHSSSASEGASGADESHENLLPDACRRMSAVRTDAAGDARVIGPQSGSRLGALPHLNF